MSELHDDENKKNEPASQTLLDLEASGLTPEDMAAAARLAAEEAEKKTPGAPSSALPFHWLVLLILSAAGALILALSAKDEPGNLRLWGLSGLIFMLLLMSALPKTNLCPRLPTRGGLAAAFFSAAIFIYTLRGQPEHFFETFPAVLAWAGLLTLSLLWLLTAVPRKLRRHVSQALGVLFLVYAALGPVTAIIGHFSLDGPELTWKTLNASPSFLTNYLPWPIWPMTLILGLALPLAAISALGDQWASLRRPGARHGGNFFLALAWLGLLPSGLLLFAPADDNFPDLIKKTRALAPILAGVEPAPSTVSTIPLDSPPAASIEAAPSAPEAVTAPEEALAVSGSLTLPEAAAIKPSESPPPVVESSTPEPLASEGSSVNVVDPLATRLEELQLKIGDLEERLQLLSDRLNQLEKPEQPRTLTPLLPPNLETPKAPAAPEQPLPAPHYGGSAT